MLGLEEEVIYPQEVNRLDYEAELAVVIKIRSYLNRKLKQNSTTANFIFSVSFLVSFISKIMTLLPADVRSTGTPFGVGEMNPGDIVEIEIEGIGILKNKVAV